MSSCRRLLVRALAFAGCVLLAMGAPGAFAAADGDSDTLNTVGGVSVGETTVSIAADRVESVRGSTRRGFATFVTGKSGETAVGLAEREALDEDGSGTESVAPGVVTLDHLSADVVDAKAEVSINSTRVLSLADAHLASVSAFDGLVEFDGLRSTSRTEVTDTAATATRSVSVDGLRILDVGGLLGAIGVDPYAVGCAGLATAAEALAADAGDPCGALTAIEGALTAAGATLADAVPELQQITTGLSRDDVGADRDEAADPSTSLAQILTIAAGYPAIVLSDPLSLVTSREELLAGLDEILAAFDDLAVIDGAELGSQCSSALDGIAEVSGALSALDPAGAGAPLQDAGDDLQTACDALSGALDAVLATRLMTLEGVAITMSSVARQDDPESVATIEVASLSVGLNDPVTVSPENAEAVADAATEMIADAVNALIGPLGESIAPPTLDLMDITRDSGRRTDGTWHASSSVSLLRLGVPAQTLTVPTGADRELDVIDPGAGTLAVSAAAAPAQTTPETIVSVGTFDTSSTFKPQSAPDDDPTDDDDDGSDGDGGDDDGDDGDGGGGASAGGSIGRRVVATGRALPTTGVPRTPMLTGLLLIAGAVVLARRTLAAR